MPELPPFVGAGAGAGAIGGAIVAVGPVSFDDNDALFNNTGSSATMFTDYMIRNSYEEDPHTYMLGISSPQGFQGDKVAFVQLASTTLVLVCRWTGCRYNEQPIVPQADPEDDNLVVLYRSPVTVSVTTGPDGVTPLYRISGTYVYGVRNPDPTLLNNVSFGLDPRYLDNFAGGRTMPTRYEDPTLMQAQAGAAGGNNAQLPRR